MISVVIPVYKVEAFIADAVSSALNQTERNIEIIIVDDCSPDKSIEICEQFDDDRIRIVRHRENRGLAGARNTGIRASRGKYIAFLDSDDMWEPTKLERHKAHLEGDPLLGISFSRSAFIDADGQRLNAYQMPRLDHVPAGYYLCRNPIGNGSAPVVRREVFEDIAFEQTLHGEKEVAYFDERFRQSEDIECWIRIRSTTFWRIEGLSEALTLYRLNSGGLSADIPKQLATWEAVIEKTRIYAPELIREHGAMARAFQLRYLARQAIRLRDGRLAVSLAHQAVRCNPRMLVREPSRTIITLMAAYTLIAAPKRIVSFIEPLAVALVGRSQRLRLALNGNSPMVTHS